MGRIGTLIENKNSLLGLGMIEMKKILKPISYLLLGTLLGK